jgi:hypothetical protein
MPYNAYTFLYINNAGGVNISYYHFCDCSSPSLLLTISADVRPIFAPQPQAEVQGAMPNKNPVTRLTRYGTIGMTPFIVLLQLVFIPVRTCGGDIRFASKYGRRFLGCVLGIL